MKSGRTDGLWPRNIVGKVSFWNGAGSRASVFRVSAVSDIIANKPSSRGEEQIEFAEKHSARSILWQQIKYLSTIIITLLNVTLLIVVVIAAYCCCW